MYKFQTQSTDHKDLIHDVAFNHYGTRMATCSSDQLLKVWDSTSHGWTLSASWKAHSGSVWKIAWAFPEFGQVLASCSFDRTVAVWEEIAGESISSANSQKHWAKRTTLVDSRTSVMDIKFAPKSMGLLLATCSADGIVRIYEAPDVMNLAQWTLQQEIACKFQASCISWNPNYTRERRCFKNNIGKLQAIFDKKDDQKFDDGEDNVSKYPFPVEKTDKYIFIPNVPMLAVGSDESVSVSNKLAILQYVSYVRRWNKIDSVPLISDPVQDLAFAPRLARSYDVLAVASKDIKIYNISLVLNSQSNLRIDMTLVATFDDHANSVWRVSWNSLGSVLATSGDDGRVRMWKQWKNDWNLVTVINGNEASPRT